ncbi:hypothetical protein [Tropicimonas sp.]|uniref:hypothetical protein n=1 Tax=Tropicimonas sp. TaxID=2067044 RepID=UPI003A88B4FE
MAAARGRVAIACTVALGMAVLSACAPSGKSAGPSGDLILKPDGLGVAGTGLEIGFGRAQAGAVQAVTRVLGEPPGGSGSLPACSGGSLATVNWAGGFSLAFRNGDLRGWHSGAGRVATASGLRVGGSYPGVGPADGSFDSGGVRGRLGDDGRIAALWAGDICPG